MAAEPLIELRLPIDAAEAPLGYEDHDGTLAVEIALAGGGYATLLVPTDAARCWAGALFDAVAVAHREATGDPHALSDLEIAFLPDAGAYDPGPGLVVSEDETGPARVRLHVAIDIEGRHLDCASLRAALVEALTARFNTTRVAVSAGEPLAGGAG
ncbi:MAG: hypothetical protein ACRD0S_03275 [Acidimicrobiales bacterium]